MLIYIDYILLINFLFDFILLLALSALLKLNAKLSKIILGALFGSVSIFILFLNINSFIFFFIKMLFGILMLIISFSYKDLKYTLNNLFYLMILSIILGGFLYFINIELGYEHVGMIFFNSGKKINILILLLISCVLLASYVKKMRKDKNNLSYYYKVKLFINNKILYLNGYLDTGNQLIDPYFNKPVLILNSNIKINSNKSVLVPFKSLNKSGLLTCFFADKIYIEKIGYKENILVATSNDKLDIPGIDIILNSKLMEELWKK